MNDASTICTNGKMKISASGNSSRCHALGRRRGGLRGAAALGGDGGRPAQRLRRHRAASGARSTTCISTSATIARKSTHATAAPRPGLAVDEAELVAVDDDHRRRIDRPAALRRPGEVEELQRVDRLPDDREHRDRPHGGQDHVAEDREAPRAVDARRLALILRHVLQRREVDQDVEADRRPGVDRGEQEERLVGVVEELLAAEAHPGDGVVDDAVLRVEDVEEDHAGRGRRGHERARRSTCGRSR